MTCGTSKSWKIFPLLSFGLFFGLTELQARGAMAAGEMGDPQMGVYDWAGVLELPFLFITVFLAFERQPRSKGAFLGRAWP